MRKIRPHRCPSLARARRCPALARRRATRSPHRHRQRRARQRLPVPRHLADLRKPAIQGGFDYAHASGFYLGTWASNVSGLEASRATQHRDGLLRRLEEDRSATAASTSARSTTTTRAPKHPATWRQVRHRRGATSADRWKWSREREASTLFSLTISSAHSSQRPATARPDLDLDCDLSGRIGELIAIVGHVGHSDVEDDRDDVDSRLHGLEARRDLRLQRLQLRRLLQGHRRRASLVHLRRQAASEVASATGIVLSVSKTF